MAGRKHQLAQTAAHLGLTRLLESIPKRPLLLILNYHRIGDASITPFDSDVFSCSTQELECQVLYLNRQFRIVGLPEALDLLDGRRPLREPTVLLSFDDGYIDNYELAFPVLARHGIPAVFYLPTSFIGTDFIPWWDRVASLVKRSPRTLIQLSTPHRRSFSLTPAHREHSIRQILDIYKGPAVVNPEGFMAELLVACDVPELSAEAYGRNFLSWDEARQMQAAGMSFGSHSHTHRILAKLPFAEQREELQLSREILEHELGIPIDTLAYPVGARSSFNTDTIRALAETGYRHAFSFISGVNRPQSGSPADPYTILRTGIFSGSLPVLRLFSSLQTLR